jgi:anthranilate phosphoribosyltransferase
VIVEATGSLIRGESLTDREASCVMREIMEGEPTEAQFGSFVTALRMKGESAEEIAGMAKVMRAHALSVDVDADFLLDTCGTGGDGMNTFNVSTASAFVLAGAGIHVAKHGNRAATSKSGSADVLEALGVKIELSPHAVAQCIRECSIGFMFAPIFHPAMRFAAPLRREIGIPTVFNVLGPLTNPAGAQRQVLGVASPDLVELMATTLIRLGSEHSVVVHGLEGLDEISIAGQSQLAIIQNGAITLENISPEDFGLSRVPLHDIRGGTAAENADMVRSVLDGDAGPRTDVVLLNAAAGMLIADLVKDLHSGIELARDTVFSGRATMKLDGLIALSNKL